MKGKIYFIFLFFYFFAFPQSKKNIDKEIHEAITLFDKGKKEEALEKFDHIISSSEKLDYSRGRAYGYINKAYYYYMSLDKDKSFQYIKLAEQEDFTKNKPLFRCRVYDFLGQLYAKSNLYDDAKKAFKNVISDSYEVPSRKSGVFMECIAYANLASLHGSSNIDSASYYSLKIYKRLIEVPDRNDSLNILLAKASAGLGLLYKFKSKDSSNYYFNKSLEYAPENVKVTNGNKWFYKHLAMIYFMNGLFEKSKTYNNMYTQYAENTKSLDEVEQAYNQALMISDTLKTKDRYQNLEKYTKLKDKISIINKHDKFVNNIVDKKNTEIKKKTNFSKYLAAIIFFLLLCTAFSGYYLRLYVSKTNFERKKILLEKQVEISELESKVNVAFEDILELAKTNSPNFLARFQEVYPEFCKNLLHRYPDIQNSDLIYCAYIKLNFSSKDIAGYTFVTYKAILMKRYRLRKKLNLTSDQDLDVWMRNLDNSTNQG